MKSKRRLLVALVCGWGLAGSGLAADGWDAKIRAALTPESKPAVTLRLAVPQSAQLPRRDVTTALLAARAHWNELSAETQALASVYLQRLYPAQAVIDEPGFSEVDFAYGGATTVTSIVSSGGHFRIHYILKTGDEVNNPKAATTAYANSVASVLENVWNVEHTTLGYASVPEDTAATNNGGDGVFDVYLTELRPAGLYGYVAPDGASPDGTRPYGEFSYMVLDNDYESYGYVNPLLPLQVTAAHEYFHAIQFGYTAQEVGSGFALLEASATWMEDQVYPTIHDNYFYLGEPYTDSDGDGRYDPGEPFTDRNKDGTRDDGSLEYPDASLDAFDDIPLIQYGRFVWFQYLAQNFGAGVIKTIFEKCGQVAGDNMLSAIDQSLQGYGSSFATAYQEYATWNYDLSRYDDGANYPAVYVDGNTSGSNYLFRSESSPSLLGWGFGYRPQLHLSSIYILIRNPAGTMSFASSGGVAALTMLVDYGSGDLDVQPVALTNGDGSWTASAGAVKAIAVISNVSPTVDGMAWSMTGSGYGTTESSSKSKSFFGAFGIAELLAMVMLGVVARRRRAAIRR
jgi:hypothetical protein